MRFSYVQYDDVASHQQQLLKEQFEAIEKQLAGLPDSRPKALCLTALEEAYMWTGKAIRDHQIARNGSEQPSRANV